MTTQATISFKDREYGASCAGEVEIKLEQTLETVSFSYDGGRLSVCINGKQEFYTMMAGSDCSVDVSFK